MKKGWLIAILFSFRDINLILAPSDMVIIFSGLTWEGFVKKVIAAHLLLLMLIACSGRIQRTPAVTEVLTEVATVTPAPSPLPPSHTPESQHTNVWMGIPVMPGATAGEGDEEGYVFTIHATSQQVQDYYQVELAGLGWQASDPETGNSSVILSFTDSTTAMLTVSILAKGDEVLVLLVK
jgi:hypothetical protein